MREKQKDYDAGLRQKLTRHETDIYRAALAGGPIELSYRLKPPYAWRDIGHHFPEFRAWNDFWQRESPYWTLQTERRCPRGFSAQADCPAAIQFHSATAMLGYLGLARDYERLRAVYAELTAAQAALGDIVLRYRDEFLADTALAGAVREVADFFAAQGTAARPRYLRELDIPHVHTKWLEQHEGLTAAIYAALYPASGVHSFAGLCDVLGLVATAPTPSIYLRSLDPALTFGGAETVMLTRGELQRITVPFRYVFVTENKLNGYAFPAVPGGVVIFGAGNGITKRLAETAETDWLARCAHIYYWGDLDRDGFRILARFRQSYPQVRSFLMDRATFAAYDYFAVADTGTAAAMPAGLTPAEQGAWQYLAEQPAASDRLEQERLPLSAVQAAVQRIVTEGQAPQPG